MRQCWEGKEYSESDCHILILGESHYNSSDKNGPDIGKRLPDNYTKNAVEYYLSVKRGDIERKKGEIYRWTAFFTKISKTFGYDDVEAFYNRILFANYIDVYCGTKNSFSTKYISDTDNRIRCNNELFELINEKCVENIVCVSTLAYNNLPSLHDTEHEYEKKTVLTHNSGKNGLVKQCHYIASVTHAYCDVLLNADINVYSVGHPSSGRYSAKCIREYLTKDDLKI